MPRCFWRVQLTTVCVARRCQLGSHTAVAAYVGDADPATYGLEPPAPAPASMATLDAVPPVVEARLAALSAEMVKVASFASAAVRHHPVHAGCQPQIKNMILLLSEQVGLSSTAPRTVGTPGRQPRSRSGLRPRS